MVDDSSGPYDSRAACQAKPHKEPAGFAHARVPFVPLKKSPAVTNEDLVREQLKSKMKARSFSAKLITVSVSTAHSLRNSSSSTPRR